MKLVSSANMMSLKSSINEYPFSKQICSDHLLLLYQNVHQICCFVQDVFQNFFNIYKMIQSKLFKVDDLKYTMELIINKNETPKINLPTHHVSY